MKANVTAGFKLTFWNRAGLFFAALSLSPRCKMVFDNAELIFQASEAGSVGRAQRGPITPPGNPKS